MRCPGQDWRYWKEDVVLEVPCPKCDAAVEFFKDESSRRCSNCGHRFRNPKVSFDCAKWCAFAEQCLGFVPERGVPPDPGQGALAARLIQAVKEEFEADRTRLAHTLMVFQHARDLLSKEGGDPRVILAAALLLEIGTDGPERTREAAGQRAGETEGPARVKQILQRVGLDEDTIRCVCRVIGAFQTGRHTDTMEFKVVWDSDVLANLAAENLGDDLGRLQEIVENRLKTKAGKQRARSLVQT